MRYAEDKKNKDIEMERHPVALSSGAENLQVVTERVMASLNAETQQLKVCTDRYLLLEICHPNAPHLDLVDLPGLVEQPAERAVALEKIVTDHFRDHGKHSIYLFVLDASRNINLSPIRLIKDHPSIEAHTIGVITHLDRERCSCRSQPLQRLAQGELDEEIGAVSLMPHGFVLTTNKPRTGEQSNGFASVYDRAHEEKHFFANSDFKDLLELKRAGCEGLLAQLNAMNFKYLEVTWIPLAMKVIDKEKAIWNSKDVELGLPRAHYELPVQKRKELLKELLSGVCDQLSRAIDVIDDRHNAHRLLAFERTLEAKMRRPLTLKNRDVQDELHRYAIELKERVARFLEGEEIYWCDTLQKFLENDISTVKFGRFRKEIEVLVELLRNQLKIKRQEVYEKVAEYFDHALLNYNCVLVRPLPGFAEREITFDVNISHVVTSMLTSAGVKVVERFFSPLILDFESTFEQFQMKGCNLVEACRETRCDVLDMLRKLDDAVNGIHELSVEMNAINLPAWGSVDNHQDE